MFLRLRQQSVFCRFAQIADRYAVDRAVCAAKAADRRGNLIVARTRGMQAFGGLAD